MKEWKLVQGNHDESYKNILVCSATTQKLLDFSKAFKVLRHLSLLFNRNCISLDFDLDS